MKTSDAQEENVNKFAHGYLRKKDVADMLKITSRAVEGWMRRGILPHFKTGKWVRFREDDIHTHLQKYRIERSRPFVPNRKSTKMENAAERVLNRK